MFDMLCLLGCSFLSAYFSVHSILIQVFLFWFLQSFQTLRGFFRCCLIMSHMSFWVLYVTSGLHLIVNPFYLHFRRRILIEVFHNDTSAYPGAFLPYSNAVKKVSCTRERIMTSSTLAVFHRRLMLLSSPGHSFFQRMYHNIDLVTGKVFAFLSLIVFSA